MAQYLTEAEFLGLSLPAEAFSTLPAGTIDKAIQAASRVADSWLRKRYALPLLAWDDDLKDAVGDLAALRLLRFRGFKPGSGTNQTITDAAKEAKEWLVSVSKGEAELSGVTESDPDISQGDTLTASDPSADWEFFVSADGGAQQGQDPFA